MAFEIYDSTRHHTQPVLGVLFDMDGLVLDTEKLYARFWREAAHSLGFPMTWEQALGMRSLNQAAGQEQLNRYFGPGASYTEFRARRIEGMDAYIALHGVEPKSGIVPLLDYLDAQHIPAAITSSSPMDRIRAYLEPLGLYHRFAKICSGYEVPRGKPAPDIYLHGAAQLGLSPENCLALEDSPAGILSAHRAGCLPVIVPDLDQPDEATKPLLYAKADSLADIPALLESRK